METEGDRYDWLDEFRAGFHEVVTFIVSPGCVCTWESRFPPAGHEYVLSARDRQCPLHGEGGLF